MSADKKGAADYYPWFDWLPLTLACIVLAAHQGLRPRWPKAPDFAVQVFFALSGWPIGGLLVQASDLRRFYFNRALRIWGPYLLALGFSPRTRL